MSRRSPAAAPPDWMLRHYRHASVPLLVLDDDPDVRAVAAETFRQAGPLRGGPLVRVDCAREEAALVAALEEWLTLGSGDRAAPALRAAERGTLYLDGIESLSPRAQRLLLAFVNRPASAAHEGLVRAGAGRLIAGAGARLAAAVAAGRFSVALLDALDKLRFEPAMADQAGAA